MQMLALSLQGLALLYVLAVPDISYTEDSFSSVVLRLPWEAERVLFSKKIVHRLLSELPARKADWIPIIGAAQREGYSKQFLDHFCNGEVFCTVIGVPHMTCSHS